MPAGTWPGHVLSRRDLDAIPAVRERNIGQVNPKFSLATGFLGQKLGDFGPVLHRLTRNPPHFRAITFASWPEMSSLAHTSGALDVLFGESHRPLFCVIPN